MSNFAVLQVVNTSTQGHCRRNDSSQSVSVGQMASVSRKLKVFLDKTMEAVEEACDSLDSLEESSDPTESECVSSESSANPSSIDHIQEMVRSEIADVVCGEFHSQNGEASNSLPPESHTDPHEPSHSSSSNDTSSSRIDSHAGQLSEEERVLDEEAHKRLPPELKEGQYDVLLIGSEEDVENMKAMQYILEEFVVLDHGLKTRVRIFSDFSGPSFASGKFKNLEQGFYRSTYTFLYITSFFCNDTWASVQGETCLAASLELESDRRWCIIPVHTQPNTLNQRRSSRKYEMPFGLKSLRGVKLYKLADDGMKDMKDVCFRDQSLLESKDRSFFKDVHQLLNDRHYLRSERERKDRREIARFIKNEKQKIRQERADEEREELSDSFNMQHAINEDRYPQNYDQQYTGRQNGHHDVGSCYAQQTVPGRMQGPSHALGYQYYHHPYYPYYPYYPPPPMLGDPRSFPGIAGGQFPLRTMAPQHPPNVTVNIGTTSAVQIGNDNYVSVVPSPDTPIENSPSPSDFEPSALDSFERREEIRDSGTGILHGSEHLYERQPQVPREVRVNWQSNQGPVEDAGGQYFRTPHVHEALETDNAESTGFYSVQRANNPFAAGDILMNRGSSVSVDRTMIGRQPEKGQVCSELPKNFSDFVELPADKTEKVVSEIIKSNAKICPENHGEPADKKSPASTLGHEHILGVYDDKPKSQVSLGDEQTLSKKEFSGYQ